MLSYVSHYLFQTQKVAMCWSEVGEEGEEEGRKTEIQVLCTSHDREEMRLLERQERADREKEKKEMERLRRQGEEAGEKTSRKGRGRTAITEEEVKRQEKYKE